MASATRRPVQKRGKETRQRLLDAASQVFGEAGLDGATTHGIAERAGVSVGSLYAYFSDKEAILAELFDRHAAEMLEIVHAPFAHMEVDGFEPRTAIRAAIEASALSHQHNPALHRTFVSLEQHDVLRDRWKAWKSKGIEGLKAILDLGGGTGALRDVDPEVAAFLVYHASEAACRRCLLEFGGPDWEDVLDGLVDMISGYLLNEPIQ